MQAQRTEWIARVERALAETIADARALALDLHAHPELRFEEHRSSGAICEMVERLTGIRPEKPLGGLQTAFRARTGRDTRVPTIAFLAEYDALPELGHACGHNLIASGATCAFVALARAGIVGELEGAVELIGTPAEEGGGGKILLLEAGAFRDVDAAMMFHPFDRNLLAHPTLANLWISFSYKGKASHAAIAPWAGQSALTACLQTFQLIDSQRVHFRDGVRVHGFVTNGGQAVNIIASHAACEFSVRARDLQELERVRSIVERCARGAALACDVELSVTTRRGYKDVRTNVALAQSFATHFAHDGRAVAMTDPETGTGSTDMGDISHAIPSIHPWVAICPCGEAQCHERRFAELAASEQGLVAMQDAARAMALTAVDYLADASLRERVQTEFRAR